MTSTALKNEHLRREPNSHFWDKETMAFFGDRMRNFGVKKHKNGFELYRRHPVKHGVASSHWFSKDFEHIITTDENIKEIKGTQNGSYN